MKSRHRVGEFPGLIRRAWLAVQCQYGRVHKLARSCFVNVAPSVDGRDRWMIGTGNTIRKAWSMPRWMSFRKSDGRVRG